MSVSYFASLLNLNPRPSSADVAEPPGSVNALAAHPTLPLLFSAHENRQIRFLDTAQGTCLHSMVAHLEGVTSLAVDPRGLILLSASELFPCFPFSTLMVLLKLASSYWS